jgi:hypothetical protein
MLRTADSLCLEKAGSLLGKCSLSVMKKRLSVRKRHVGKWQAHCWENVGSVLGRADLCWENLGSVLGKGRLIVGKM